MSLDNSTIMQTAAQGDAETLRADLRQKALTSFYYFAKVVMNNTALSPTYHLPKCDRIQSEIWKQRRGELWPRAHFKSTILTKAYVLWRLCGGGWTTFDYKIPSLDPRNRRWLLVGESDGRVTDAIKNIKHHLLNNQMLRWLFPEIIPPDPNKTTWRDDAILLPRSMAFDEPTIRGVGIGTKITGYHGDGFIFDDVIGEKAAKSEADMKAAKEWLDYLPGLINDPAIVEMLFVGTRWKHGNADVYGMMMEEQPFMVGEDGIPSGISWNIYSAIEKDAEGNDVAAFRERFSLKMLEDIRKVQKDYKFSCQYLNIPSTPAGADFPADSIHTYAPEVDGEGRLTRLVTDDGTPPVTLQSLIRISFYDPSSGGKSAECENAIVVLGTASDGRQFVLDCFLANCGYRAAIEKWHTLNDKFVCYKNHYENVGAQKEIEEIITMRRLYQKCEMCEKQHRKLTPIGIRPEGGNMNKEDRIRLYMQATVEESKLYLRQGMFQLRNQITSFPHGKMKDGLDALAYAIHCSTRPSTDTEIQDKKEEAAKAALPHSARVQTTRQYGGYA